MKYIKEYHNHNTLLPKEVSEGSYDCDCSDIIGEKETDYLGREEFRKIDYSMKKYDNDLYTYKLNLHSNNYLNYMIRGRNNNKYNFKIYDISIKKLEDEYYIIRNLAQERIFGKVTAFKNKYYLADQIDEVIGYINEFMTNKSLEI